MKSTADLHHLIKSMTKSEKRFFKLSSSIHSGNKNYLVLFDAIEKQKTYNEERLKKKFQNESFVRNLAYEKNYLFGLVLKTLRNYHSDTSIDSQLYEMIEHIALLHSRKLYSACEKLLHKAKKIALLHERNIALMEILKWEWELMHATYSLDDLHHNLNNILKQYREASDKIHNLNKFKVAASNVFLNTYKGVHIRDEEQQEVYKKLGAMPVLADEKQALSYDAKSYFYLLKANLFFVRRDWKNALKMSTALLTLLESNSAKMQEEPRKYIIVLNNIISSCNALNKKEEFFYYLERLKKFPAQLNPSKKAGIEEESFLYYNHTLLQYYWHNGLFEEGVKRMENIAEEFLFIAQNKLYANHGILIKCLFAQLYFGEKKYSEAIHWLNKVIHQEASVAREDIMSTALLFNIILHYEYGNEDILDYLVRSTFRYLYRKKRLYKFENIMLEFMRKKLSKADTKDKLITAFISLRKELTPLIKDPYENKMFEQFNFINWLDSRIQNKSLKEIVIENKKTEA